MVDRRKEIATLDADERDAWTTYLERTQEAKRVGSYADTEPWAWSVLRATLIRIKRRRRGLAA